MTEKDVMDAMAQIRRTATNVIGFHALAEADDIAQRPEARLQYEAQVYAGGVALAVQISKLMESLRPETH